MAKKKLGSTKLVDEVLVTSVNLASDVTGTLPVTNGGTGQTAYTDGQLLIGNTATGGLSKATLTQGSGVTITNGNGTITIASSSSGTVNSGTINQLAYYAATGTAVSGLPTANSGVLVTSGTGVPSIATDIPTAVTIGGQYIYRVGGTDVSVADGGTGLSSGTQGGILWYSASGTLASTALLTQYAPVVGGGAGSAPHSIAGGVGAANQVLISNGGGSDPSWNLIGPNQIQSVLNNRFASISFTAGAESGNAIPVTGTAANLSGTTIASTETIVELIVSDSATDGEPSATATFSAVTTGQPLAGLGTSTLRVQTSAAGQFVASVSETAVGSRYLWVRQGHGSQTWVRANAAPFTLTFA
jgi:hypothetical protein